MPGNPNLWCVQFLGLQALADLTFSLNTTTIDGVGALPGLGLNIARYEPPPCPLGVPCPRLLLFGEAVSQSHSVYTPAAASSPIAS